MVGGPKNIWEKIGVITAFILAVTGIVAVLQECSGAEAATAVRKRRRSVLRLPI